MADFVVDFAHRCDRRRAPISLSPTARKNPSASSFIRVGRIFYSLGTTIFQLETPQVLAEEAYARYGLGSNAGPADFADTRYQNDSVGHPADRTIGSR